MPSSAPVSRPAPGSVLPEVGPPSLTSSSLGYARSVVARHVPPTPTYRWPLLEDFTRTETWVKHENHTPDGRLQGARRAELRRAAARVRAAPRRAWSRRPAATTARASPSPAAAVGLPVTIVVPEGNSPDKNAAMEGFGAELVVHGARLPGGPGARRRAGRGARPAHRAVLPPAGWSRAWRRTPRELHESVRDLDVIYVPVGMGSGICANIVVRDLLGLRTEIVGVVAEKAPAYALSFERPARSSTPRPPTRSSTASPAGLPTRTRSR